MLMCRGELSVYKAAPLRLGLRDNFPLTDTPRRLLPLQSQSVPGSAVRPSQALEDRLRDVLLLDEISPYLRHLCQCLGDVVGGHALCPEIQDHTFFIVSPKDAINKIIPTRPQDMDRAHGGTPPLGIGVTLVTMFRWNSI